MPPLMSPMGYMSNAQPQMTLPPLPAPQQQQPIKTDVLPPAAAAAAEPSAQLIEASPPNLNLGHDSTQVNAEATLHRSELLDDSVLNDLASPPLMATEATPMTFGLSLRKTGSFLDLITDNLASGGQWTSTSNQLS